MDTIGKMIIFTGDIDMYAKKVLFTGKVQAVGFRNDTCRIMSHFDLTGYVKNIEPNGPYSGDKVELFIQSENNDELKQAVQIVKLYFGAKHIQKTTVKKAKPDTKIKSFEQQRTDWADWYKVNRPLSATTGTAHKSGFGAGIMFNDFSDWKDCIVCGFQTSFKCDCGKVHLCKLCRLRIDKAKISALHICTKTPIPEKRTETPIHKAVPEMVIIRENGQRFAKDCIENLCLECGRLYTTMRADCCNSTLCRSCAETGLHKCKARQQNPDLIKKIIKSVF